MSELSNKDPIQLKNYMEDVIFHALNDLIEKNNFCRCHACRMDIAAWALNRLPPKYAATQEGEAYTKILELHQQFHVDVTLAVLKAMAVVGANPRHTS